MVSNIFCGCTDDLTIKEPSTLGIWSHEHKFLVSFLPIIALTMYLKPKPIVEKIAHIVTIIATSIFLQRTTHTKILRHYRDEAKFAILVGSYRSLAL